MNYLLCPRCREHEFIDASHVPSPQIALNDDGEIILTGKDEGEEIYLCMHCRIYWNVPHLEKVDYAREVVKSADNEGGLNPS